MSGWPFGDEVMVPGQRYRVSFDHDFGAVAFEATLVAIYEQGEVDPLVVLDAEAAARDPEANQIGWQSPRTYWDSGLVMDGGLEWVEWVEPTPPSPLAEAIWLIDNDGGD